MLPQNLWTLLWYCMNSWCKNRLGNILGIIIHKAVRLFDKILWSAYQCVILYISHGFVQNFWVFYRLAHGFLKIVWTWWMIKLVSDVCVTCAEGIKSIIQLARIMITNSIRSSGFTNIWHSHLSNIINWISNKTLIHHAIRITWIVSWTIIHISNTFLHIHLWLINSFVWSWIWWQKSTIWYSLLFQPCCWFGVICLSSSEYFVCFILKLTV